MVKSQYLAVYSFLQRLSFQPKIAGSRMLMALRMLLTIGLFLAVTADAATLMPYFTIRSLADVPAAHQRPALSDPRQPAASNCTTAEPRKKPLTPPVIP